MQVADKYLMVVNENDTRFKHPGGHVNTDESLTDAMIREVKEETGYDLKNEDVGSIVFDQIDLGGNLMINGYTKISLAIDVAEEMLSKTPLQSRLFKIEELNDENTYRSEIEVIEFFLGK
jgi:8-oxo-dGTP pyrophosphatase MutT (NUDIX family)